MSHIMYFRITYLRSNSSKTYFTSVEPFDAGNKYTYARKFYRNDKILLFMFQPFIALASA